MKSKQPLHYVVNQPHAINAPINLKQQENLKGENCDYTLITQRVNELTSQLEKLDEIIKIQGEEIDLLRNENERLRNQQLQTPRDEDDEISQLRKHNDILEQEKHHLQEYYTKQQMCLEGNIRKLENELSRKSTNIRESTICEAEDEQTVLKLKHEVNQLNRILQNKNQELEYLTSQLQDVSEQLSCKGQMVKLQNYKKSESNLLKDNNMLQQQIQYLQEQFQIQVDALEEKVKIILKENDRLQQQQNFTARSDPQFNLQSCIKTLSETKDESQLTVWKQQNLYLKDQLANILEEFQILKHSYDSSNNQILQLESEKESLNAQLRSLQVSFDKEQIATQNAKAHCIKLAQDKLSTDTQNQQLQIQCLSLQKQVELLKNQINEINDLNGQKQEVIEKLGELSQLMELQLEEKQNLFLHTENELSRQKQKIEIIERENRYLQGQNNNFKNNRKKVLGQFNQANKEQIQKLNENEKLRSQLISVLKQLEAQK